MPTSESSSHNEQATLALKTVSHVEPTILLALVKGLVDVDTKGKILSKVKQMDLDETVAFVEARETHKRGLVLLPAKSMGSRCRESAGDVVKKDTLGKLQKQHLMTSNSSAPAYIPRPKKTRQTLSAEAPFTWIPSSA